MTNLQSSKILCQGIENPRVVAERTTPGVVAAKKPWTSGVRAFLQLILWESSSEINFTRTPIALPLSGDHALTERYTVSTNPRWRDRLNQGSR